MTLNTKALLPCPFCDGEAISENRKGKLSAVVRCGNECVVCPEVYSMDLALAKALWNNRPAAPRLARRVIELEGENAALRAALEPFTRGPDKTSLAKLYAHLNREHYLKARAALTIQGEG